MNWNRGSPALGVSKEMMRTTYARNRKPGAFKRADELITRYDGKLFTH